MSERPLRVLSVCTSDYSGGAARAAYRIHLAVRELGVDSRMFVKHKGTDDQTVLTVDDFIPHNALYRAFDWIRNKFKNKWQHYQWGKYPDRQKFFLSDLRSTDIGHALQKIDYDILHLHWVNLRFLPLEQLPKDKPIVWTLHDSWPFCGVCHSFIDCTRYQDECGCCPRLSSTDKKDLSHKVWKKKQKLYKGLDIHIVTPSRWLGECVRKSSLLGSFPVSVIPNIIDTDLFRPLEKDEISPRWQCFKESSPKKHYLVFGAMNATQDRIKGFSYLLSALSKLKDAQRSDIELIVFGSDKPLDGLSDIVPTHYVGVIGSSHDLVSLYNIASVVVVPSLSEVFGLVAAEAMSCGTPVVAFRCTGIQEVVAPQSGYLADPYDAEDFARGIDWCLEHNTDGELSHNARKSILSRYTPEAVGRQYLAEYSELE